MLVLTILSVSAAAAKAIEVSESSQIVKQANMMAIYALIREYLIFLYHLLLWNTVSPSYCPPCFEPLPWLEPW